MRKISIILITIILTLSSCRKSPDYVPYIGETSKMSYSTYAEQFDVLWNNINTGYVFWDVDKTDWDGMYEKYMPQFEALDARYESGKAVETKELQALYDEIMGGLIDHHMYVQLKNIHPSFSNNSFGNNTVVINPANNEIVTRDYYYKENYDMSNELQQFIKRVAANKESDYKVVKGDFQTVKVDDSQVSLCYILFQLPDGRYIPYLWQDSYRMSTIMTGLNNPQSRYYKAAQLIDSWKQAALKTDKKQLAGIILDNRCNSGGSSADVNHVVAPFIKQDLSVVSTRYKEGPGRLEHSVWSPMTVEPSTQNRDLAAENIPYVVLSNLYSISMGEITTYNVSQLPTGYVVGERTYGATGPLLPGYIDMTYGGPFGDMQNENHYVYTSTFEMQTHEGFVPEGIGFTPDKEVLTKTSGVKGQLDAALKYITEYK